MQLAMALEVDKEREIRAEDQLVGLFLAGMVVIGSLTWFAVRNTGKRREKRAARRRKGRSK